MKAISEAVESQAQATEVEWIHFAVLYQLTRTEFRVPPSVPLPT
jgi:hypothetical protein